MHKDVLNRLDGDDLLAKGMGFKMLRD